jgi:hypothetical protein
MEGGSPSSPPRRLNNSKEKRTPKGAENWNVQFSVFEITSYQKVREKIESIFAHSQQSISSLG